MLYYHFRLSTETGYSLCRKRPRETPCAVRLLMAGAQQKERERRARIKEREDGVYFSLQGKVKWRGPALCSLHASVLRSFW